MPGVSGKARAGLVLPRYIAANTTSLALIVEGPGMDTLFASYPAGSQSISIDVPAGHARTFTLLLNSPSATLQGAATVDLLAGETKDVTLTPTVAGTQIVIPDYINSRIVQISDMSGTGWTAKASADFGGTSTFKPYDIDFDSQGRIYIANYTITTPGALGAVIRIDDISHTAAPGTSGVINVDATSMNVNSIAVDRVNSYVYYLNMSTLLRKNVNDDSTVPPTTSDLASETAIGTIVPRDIAVDEQGMLYIAIPSQTGPGFVVKYNPNLPLRSRVIANSSPGYTFSSPWSVMVQGPYVYVSDSGAGNIVRLDKSTLAFVDSFAGQAGDTFGRPEAFLATLNRKITVVDEDPGVDRIASFDDMTGAGWTTYGSQGAGQNQFAFYNAC
jgi:hypothetical protein